MSKLDDIVLVPALWEYEDYKKAKADLKDLIRDLIDETFDKDDTKALELWRKVEAL